MKLKDASLLRTQSYINGEWVGAADGLSFAVHNPADGSLIAEVADLGAADVTRAIDVAVPAHPVGPHLHRRRRHGPVRPVHVVTDKVLNLRGSEGTTLAQNFSPT